MWKINRTVNVVGKEKNRIMKDFMCVCREKKGIVDVEGKE